jgi:hypothetical protein
MKRPPEWACAAEPLGERPHPLLPAAWEAAAGSAEAHRLQRWPTLRFLHWRHRAAMMQRKLVAPAAVVLEVAALP